jgi:hypothetical protein
MNQPLNSHESSLFMFHQPAMNCAAMTRFSPFNRKIISIIGKIDHLKKKLIMSRYKQLTYIRNKIKLKTNSSSTRFGVKLYFTLLLLHYYFIFYVHLNYFPIVEIWVLLFIRASYIILLLAFGIFFCCFIMFNVNIIGDIEKLSRNRKREMNEYFCSRAAWDGLKHRCPLRFGHLRSLRTYYCIQNKTMIHHLNGSR